MELTYIEGSVVRTIRNLKKVQTISDSFSTRTNTPSQEMQTIDVISNREEIKHILADTTPAEIYDIIKTDNIIVRDLLMEPQLSTAVVRRIESKILAFKESSKIQDAKRSINAKIEERMNALRKQLESKEHEDTNL
ncbi:hypothetical protein SteCoe_28928 [Stentor coeruleus]|uniref:Uncharacterized protein n=1 Tax=Stentor coeruleus TaxID=5963 RepID=A0A1R2B778_9CILI|nr:hypothetical protein SteCoe_28928 [Stentor coeruleus]